MGADRVLVEALTRAEYAKNPRDLSRIFEMSYGGAMAVVAGGESAAKSISAAVMQKNLKEAERLEAERRKIEAYKEGVLSEFDKRTNEAYKTLSTQAEGGEEGPMNQKFADVAWKENSKIRDEIEELLDQPKSRERDKRILDLRMKSNKITNGLMRIRGTLLTVAQSAGTSKGESGVDTEASFAKDGGEGMRILTRVFTNDGYAGITPIADEKGNLFIDIERAVAMTREELLADGFSQEEADQMIRDGGNIMMKTTRMTAAELSGLVVWKDEDAQVGIMTEITAGAETALSKENKEQMKFGQEPEEFNFEGTKDNIRKQIRTKDFGDKKENLYNMIYAEFNGQKSSYAEATKNHPVVQAARYLGVTVGGLGPADADSDGDVELTRTEDGLVDESGNLVSDADWATLQDKLLKPETQEEKDAVAEDIAWYYARQSEVKFDEDIASYKQLIKARDRKLAVKNINVIKPEVETGFAFEPQWGYDLKYPVGEGNFEKTKIKGRVINVAAAKLESSKEGDNIDGWNGNIYKYINGEWRNETTGEATTRNQIVKDLGLGDYGISWDDPITVKFGGGYTPGGGAKPTTNWGVISR